MPMGVGPGTSNTFRARRRDASARLVATSCAHFNPARLNAFDADVTVTE
jgi:hypothetical protein